MLTRSPVFHKSWHSNCYRAGKSCFMVIINTFGGCLRAPASLGWTYRSCNTEQHWGNQQQAGRRLLPDIMQVAEKKKPALRSLTAPRLRRYWGHFVGGAVLLRLLTLSRFCLLTGAPPTPFLPRRSCANFSVIHFSSVLNNAINVTLMSSTRFTAPLPVCRLLWLVTGGRDTSPVRESDGGLFFKPYMW